MLELVLIAAAVTLTLLVAVAAAILILRLSSRLGPDFPFLVGLLGGVSLTASALTGLRSEPSPWQWLLLFAGVFWMVAFVLASAARRHRPDLL